MDAIQKLEGEIEAAVAEAAVVTSRLRLTHAELQTADARRQQLKQVVARAERRQRRLEEAVTESEEALETAENDISEVTKAEAEADAKLKEVQASALVAVRFGAATPADQEAAVGVVPFGLYGKVEEARKDHLGQVARARRKVAEAQAALHAFDLFEVCRAADAEGQSILLLEAQLQAATAAGQTHVQAVCKKVRHMQANLAALQAAQAGGAP